MIVDTTLAIVAGAALLIGYTVGRITAPKTKTTIIHPTRPRATRDDAVPDAEVRSLVLAGRKIEAIKRYRRLHDVGLKEAKEAVDRLG